MTLLPDTLIKSAHSISGLAHRLFSLNPTEPFKSAVKVATIVGVIFAVMGTLISKTFPWLRSKWNSRSIAKCLGTEFPVPSVERAIRYYVRPWCQDIDPAGAEEPRLVFGVQQGLFETLDNALTHPTEYHFIILLADSGMGKTSALINYYAWHLKRWRKPFKLALMPFGIPEADERIAAITERSGTILFLDALD